MRPAPALTDIFESRRANTVIRNNLIAPHALKNKHMVVGAIVTEPPLTSHDSPLFLPEDTVEPALQNGKNAHARAAGTRRRRQQGTATSDVECVEVLVSDQLEPSLGFDLRLLREKPWGPPASRIVRIHDLKSPRYYHLHFQDELPPRKDMRAREDIANRGLGDGLALPMECCPAQQDKHHDQYQQMVNRCSVCHGSSCRRCALSI